MSYERASTVALFGLPITNVTMAEAVGLVEEAVASGETHQIATANLDFARNSLRDGYLQKIICDCSMVLPDGAPMIWASKLFGRPLRERVTGVDLIPELAKLSAQRGYGIFLLGSDDRNAQAASRILEQKHPGVRIVGRYAPPICALHEMDDAEILRRIRLADPDILLVAFGNPKQEIWIHRNLHQLKVGVAIGIGGALEMIAGSLKRAPRWIQRLQMEWLFRMAQEPFRLLPRYARDAAALLRHLPMVLAVSRMQPDQASTGKLKVVIQDDVRTITTPSTITGEHCAALSAEANAAAMMNQSLVVDMAATTRVEADGLGCLLQARRVVLAAGGSIWLAGMSNPVRRVLQFSAMTDLFRVAPTLVDAVRFASLERKNADWKVPYVAPAVHAHAAAPKTAIRA
jgi:N-acetylglucosaminyldiphosphoundecaprenol N-acetyl-beta-D-mannosaminyltransferase